MSRKSMSKTYKERVLASARRLREESDDPEGWDVAIAMMEAKPEHADSCAVNLWQESDGVPSRCTCGARRKR